MIPEQQISTRVPTVNQEDLPSKAIGTQPTAASQRGYHFNEVMTSAQLTALLSPEETGNADFHNMIALLNRLLVETSPGERVRIAFVLRNYVQEYRKKHQRIQHNDAPAMLITQLDSELFDDTFPADIRSGIVRISSVSADTAAFIYQVAERRERIYEGTRLARMMIQWAQDVLPDSESAVAELKQVFSQLEHIWNNQPCDINVLNAFHGYYATPLRHKFNTLLAKEPDLSSQLTRLAPYDNNLLLIAHNHHHELRFVARHMKNFKEAGFTTLVLEQLNTEEGKVIARFLRTGQTDEALSDFLQTKNQSGEGKVWEKLLEEASRENISILPLDNHSALTPTCRTGMIS